MLNLTIFKNRTVIGLICIALSLIICFALTPLLNSAARAQTEIVRISDTVKKGEVITAGKLETVKIGAYNLPDNVVKSKDEVIGKYAAAELQKGDYMLSTKVSGTPLTEFEYLTGLDGTKQAMSITIKSFAAGLSGKLEPGDIISLISADSGNTGITAVPPELKYVQVLAVTLGTGTDKEYKAGGIKSGDGEKELPSTLTLLVNSDQAKVLAGLEQNGNLQVTLVYRGSKDNADKFLAAQDRYFKTGESAAAGTVESSPQPEEAKTARQEDKNNAE
ncbi:Flp pilus assembly protein CpaB [Dehalobacter restrictus]|jgi:pilus assembly protein CpaB|uniref:Flp pilus assembly protein CpaB n=1 Tax=Dehalobacter restrictus TaxID=55583 RepID=UPI00338F4896